MREKIMGFARLARPANLPTAAADILAGIAISLALGKLPIMEHFLDNVSQVLWLIFASVVLYAGGVVFNDVFDAKLDAIERPERAIPSGLISINEAIIWGTLLLGLGIFFAFNVTFISGLLAIVLVGAILIYDAIAKSHSFFGPLVMGICRGLNLILGMSIINRLDLWWVAVVPVIYIFAITLISRGEVHGNNKNHILLAGILYVIVVMSIGIVSLIKTESIAILSPFLLVFTILIFRPLIIAYRENSPKNIKKAVMAGVLSLIVMDACWAVGFSNWYLGLAVLLLLPLSILLSKLFAVT